MFLPALGLLKGLVYGDISDKVQEPRSPVPWFLYVKDFWVILEKARCALPPFEHWMSDQLNQERDIRFNPSDAKLLQRPIHLLDTLIKC